MPQARVRARAGGDRRRRHGGADGGEHAGDGRGALRRADGRRRPQHAQYAPRRRGDRVHARARRREGADHRYRICADGREGSCADFGEAARHRHRRRARARRQAPRQVRLRGVHRRRRSRIRMAAPRRRVECDLAQLHVGHDRQSEGRGLPSSRRLSQRPVEHHRLGDAQALGVPVDVADVPLQRLVLRVDDGGQRRRQRLPAQGRGEGDLRRDARAQGYPLLRRADRPPDADQCARGNEEGDRPEGALLRRRRGAARRGHRGHGADGIRHHARVRPHRDLRPRRGVREARRVGRARHRGAHRKERPAGRPLHGRGGDDGDGPGDHGRGPVGRRDDGRDHVSRQHHDEGLPEESQGDRGSVRRRLVPFGRSRRDAARRLREDQGPLEGHHHLGRREHQLARGRGCALPASVGARGGGRRATRSEVGRDAVRVRRAQVGRRGDRRGDHRALPRAPRALQGAEARDLLRAAEDLDRQDPEVPAARAGEVDDRRSNDEESSVRIHCGELASTPVRSCCAPSRTASSR